MNALAESLWFAASLRRAETEHALYGELATVVLEGIRSSLAQDPRGELRPELMEEAAMLSTMLDEIARRESAESGMGVQFRRA